MTCLHCHEPITQVVAGAFRSWRHADGRMFCFSGVHIATPDYSKADAR